MTAWLNILIERNADPKRPNILKEPIRIRLVKGKGVPSKDELQRQAKAQVDKQITQRMAALFERGSKLGHSDETTLAVIGALQELDAPCFQVELVGKTSEGRRAHWDDERLFRLWVEVRAIATIKGCSEREAVTVAHKGMNGRERPAALGTLLRRFAQAKKSAMVRRLGPMLEAYGLDRLAADIRRAYDKTPEALAALHAAADQAEHETQART